MGERKIAITKNGYDILRIVEGSKDGDKCEFKILPRIDAKNIDIYSMKLFSKSECFEFDRNRKIEITYHKSTNDKPTKIHVKQINRNNKEDIIYNTLPLTELLDPDVNTEIPIPLLKIIVPDEILTVPYRRKPKEHREIDIKDNNIIEIYMTRNGYIEANMENKWFNLRNLQCGNAMQYYATGLDKYVSQNINMSLVNISRGNLKERVINIGTDVTKDIGIKVNTVKYPDRLRTEKLRMLFIENSAYLGFLGGPKMYTREFPNGKPAYKYDIDNVKYFSNEEKSKWENIFQMEFKKLDRLIKESNGKYQKQFEEQDIG